MMQIPTAMRVAFENAEWSPTRSVATADMIVKALRRGVGLITRRQWWSVIRGGR